MRSGAEVPGCRQCMVRCVWPLTIHLVPGTVAGEGRCLSRPAKKIRQPLLTVVGFLHPCRTPSPGLLAYVREAGSADFPPSYCHSARLCAVGEGVVDYCSAAPSGSVLPRAGWPVVVLPRCPVSCRRSVAARLPGGRLPAYGLLEDVAVGGILGREGAAAVLDAEHHQRLAAVVADRAASLRRHAYHASFAYGEALAVDL